MKAFYLSLNYFYITKAHGNPTVFFRPDRLSGRPLHGIPDRKFG